MSSGRLEFCGRSASQFLYRCKLFLPHFGTNSIGTYLHQRQTLWCITSVRLRPGCLKFRQFSSWESEAVILLPVPENLRALELRSDYSSRIHVCDFIFGNTSLWRCGFSVLQILSIYEYYRDVENKEFCCFLIILCIIERVNVNCPFFENGQFAFRGQESTFKFKYDAARYRHSSVLIAPQYCGSCALVLVLTYITRLD